MNPAKLIALLLSVCLVGGIVYGMLFTELGVFFGGYRFWMGLAAYSDFPELRSESVQRVLNGTQYGVDQAESWVLAHGDRTRRIRLWKILIERAPNEGWRSRYSDHLQREQAESTRHQP